MERQDQEPDGRSGGPPFAVAALLLGAAAASRFLAVAAAPGEIDEAVFAGAVTRFDLFDLSPQAPGFPVWILIGRLLRPLFVSPFQALAFASALLAALSLPALFTWGRSLVGGWAALSGTLLAASLPVVWVNSGRAFSDTPSTAFFLLALAALALAGRAEEPGGPAEVLRAAPYAAAGLLAAAGAGVRPHLALAFGPLLAVEAVRAWRRSPRLAAAFVGAGLLGTAAWGTWLLAEAGGPGGLRASVAERAGFRAHAFATGTFGALADSFLVRDFVSPKRAAAVLALALVGFAALSLRRRGGAFDAALVLVPTFLSLWFLHSRAMSRYSVPFVLVLSLLAAAGLEAILRKRLLGFAATVALAAVFAREGWSEARESARTTPPPSAAVARLESYAHAGRETIVADDVFHAFLRTERWEGRLVAWGYLDSEFVERPLQMNRRLVRLSDFTSEPDDPRGRDPAWQVWWRGGRVAEALGNRRLLTVGLRDPAPPLFGPGFGVKESAPGIPSFRWAGPAAHLVVPGLDGPPAAFLEGDRPVEGGPTRLTVTEVPSGRVVLKRTIAPGPFDLAIVDGPVYGPLERPRQYLVSCDRPAPLPPLDGGVRPLAGCFRFRDATVSVPRERLWDPMANELRVDVGSPGDFRAAPEGFHGRETLPGGIADYRWTSGDAAVTWIPRPGFAPWAIAVRAMTPGGVVTVAVTVDGAPAGKLTFRSAGFSEQSLVLPPEAVAALSGTAPVRIGLSSPTVCPKRAGAGSDERELGVGVDRVIVRGRP
jgi:hypothetical protein